MEKWLVESQSAQRILTHVCAAARSNDTADVLRQDIGGGYVRCERCGDKFMPAQEPGNPRLLLCLKLPD